MMSEHIIDCYQDVIEGTPAQLALSRYPIHQETSDEKLIAFTIIWVNSVTGQEQEIGVHASLTDWIGILEFIGTGETFQTDDGIHILPCPDGYYRWQFRRDDQLAWVYITDGDMAEIRDIMFTL